MHYVKALYIDGQDLKNHRKTQEFPQWAVLWRLWRENSLIKWKKPLAEPDSMWFTICLDRYGWAEKNGEERRDGWKRGERRERRERPQWPQFSWGDSVTYSRWVEATCRTCVHTISSDTRSWQPEHPSVAIFPCRHHHIPILKTKRTSQSDAKYVNEEKEQQLLPYIRRDVPGIQMGPVALQCFPPSRKGNW